MKKTSYELLDDGFVNLYEEGIFIRCFEYSAVLVSQLTGYRLFANIDKKSSTIFLECAFPKNKIDEIIGDLENRGYMIRFVDKDGNINETFGDAKVERKEEILKQVKINLIKF